MQMLYALSRDPQLSMEEAMRRYRESVSRSFELYLFYLYYVVKIAEYARKDAERRAAKYLPNEEDKYFTPRLFENDLVKSLTGNQELGRLYQRYRIVSKVDDDMVRAIYTEFSKKESYKAYLQKAHPDAEDHAAQLLDLVRLCLSSESLSDATEDWYPNWEDDKSLVTGALKKTFKALPASPGFYEDYLPPEEATVEFGETLLTAVHDKDAELLSAIEPTLKNWDVQRVAILDMIMLKMALCELLSFPTIPTKVTLNEFVEISKQYSTEKSKDFINGILDRLLKQLLTEGKIKKEGRGLLDN
jgi:N utilization substance protein B